MKHQVISSVTATVLMSAISTVPGLAQQIEGWQQSAPDDAAASPRDVEALQLSDAETQDFFIPQSTQVLASSQTAASASDISLVNAHTLDGRQAATLYISNIPVLTFLGPVASSEAKAAASPESEPVMQAAAVGAHLNQLYADGFDAETIDARWDDDLENYVVTAADDVLVALGDTVILPDTTQDVAEDTLQVANRLRRLLGDADPVVEIANRPRPSQPVGEAVAVRSSTTGIASWYGPGFHGRQSASGERFNQNALTAAHRTLPFGTRVRVTNLNNGRQVVVRINDRGPYSGGRVIDLSAGAAREIGLIGAGVGPVQLEVLAD
ncbi:MAG: septal ring lytic transglycosylase RlpA family protein [Leptolyngbya sp. SIO4C1]|nr:septal ring lytic transglycosylase RlpA family protein [Leptolyngbya sp. SIO4C1]